MKTLLPALVLITFLNFPIKAQTPLPQLQPGEKYTGLYSISQDYQTSGSVRYIVQDPSNSAKLCAILMGQQDSNTAWGNIVYTQYSYSEDNGYTWTAYGIDPEPESPGYRFPQISLNNGLPVISAFRSNSGVNVFKELFFGAYAFYEIPNVPAGGNWSNITGTAKGNIVLLRNNSNMGQSTVYNGQNWTPVLDLPLINSPSGNFSVASGTNGVVGVFGINNSGDGYIYWYKSVDNGLTFDNGNLAFNYFVDGTDTLYAQDIGGMQAVFQGTEPHLVFTVYKVSSIVFPNQYTTAYIKPKILHWSPSTGVTELAGNFNIWNLADTITTALMAPVGQPSLSISAGNALSCTFTVFLRGNTQTVDDGSVLNAGEIFYSQSQNNGFQWGYPINITNTPGLEEKHSSLMEKASSDTAKVLYLRDMKAGSWVNVSSWGKASVYGIYKSVYTLVGINQTGTELNSFKLSQNYPNPFNPNTTIRFDIDKSDFTTLQVYDINGREVGRLVNEQLNPGSYEVEFSSGEYNLASGVYIYKLVSGNYTDTKRMILLK